MPDAPGHLQLLGVPHEAEERKAAVVTMLERYLEKARDGRYDSILLVADPAIDSDGMLDFAYTTSGDLLGLVGRLERLKHIVLRRMDPEP